MIVKNLLYKQISYQNTLKVAGPIMMDILGRSTIFWDLIFHGEETESSILGTSVKKKTLISYLINLEYTMLLGVIRKLWRN